MLPLKSFFAAAVLLAGTGEARAASVQLDYSREAAPRCPDEQAFKDVVAARLGSDPFVDSSPARLVVTLARAGQSFEGHAELREGQDVRWSEPTASLPNCVQVVRALGLAVATRLRELPADAQSVTPLPSPEAPPIQPAPSSIVPPTRSPVVVRPAPVADRTPSAPRKGHLRLGVDGGLAIGSVPGNFSAEVAAGVGYLSSPFGISGEIRWTIPRRTAEARGTRLVAAVVPCAHWRIKTSPEFFTCGVVQGGVLFGSPLGGLHPDDTLVLRYLGLGLRLGVDIPLMPPRLVLRLGADAVATVVQPQFALDNHVVWATSPVTAVIGVGGVISL